MATYVGLVKLTDQGIRNVKETTKRAKAFREMAEKAGETTPNGDIAPHLGNTPREANSG